MNPPKIRSKNTKNMNSKENSRHSSIYQILLN